MVALVLFTLVASFVFCGLYKRLAQRWQIYDIPNERSAHELPVPRGGGVGVYLGLLAGCLVSAATLGHWNSEFYILLALAGLLVGLGILDDLYGLSIWLRFTVYGLVCAGAVYLLLGGLMPALLALGAFYALWLLNLFNFMDGIDAIAGTETLFVGIAAAGISLWWAGPSQYALFCLLLAAASTGFLHFNWPPAQLFMGDAGSVSIGFMLAMLSLLGELHQALPLASWLILLGVFICDATVTLVWRMTTGQRFIQAHSLHLYQRLSRYWGAHIKVVWAVMAVNVLWLAPLAIAATQWREQGGWLLGVAYLPLLAIMIKTKQLP